MINFFFKEAPEDWRKKRYFAEKHLPKTEKIRHSPTQTTDLHFTWETGLILFLLLTSCLPRSNATNSSRAKGRSDVGTRLAPEVSLPLVTAFIFNTCPAEAAPEQPKPPKANFNQLLEKKKSGKRLSKRQKKRLRKLMYTAVTTEVKQEVNSVEIAIQDKIVGDALPEHRKLVVDTIMTLRSSHHDIQYMIDTVLTQLPGMQILLSPRADILAQNKDVNLEAFYSTPVRCIVVTENSTAGTILHEFRHAFWHTYQIANSPNRLTLSTQLWNRNLDEQQRLAIKTYFHLGDERIKKFLNPKLRDNAELQRVKALFASAPEHYTPIFRKKALIGFDSNCAEYPFGKPYKHDPSLTVHSCQVILKDDRGSIIRDHPTHHHQYLLIVTNEPSPLKNALEQILISIREIRLHYHPDHYYFEREAYLYGVLPIPLIEHFYLELLEYTRKLTKDLVLGHTLFPKNRVAVRNFSSFMDLRLRMIDIKFIEQLWPEEQLKIASYQADDLWAAGKHYYHTLSPILRYLLKLEFEVAEVFQKLITVYCEQEDHQSIVDSVNQLELQYRNIQFNMKVSRCLISSFHHLRQFDMACQHAIKLLRKITASFDQLIQENGIENTLENQKFCQEIVRSSCLTY